MQTVVTRLLAAILATIMLAGCGPRVEPFPAKTPEQLQQLTEVTDRVLTLVSSSEREPAMRQAIAALTAAQAQYQQHSDALVSKTNSEVRACISSQSLEIMELETMIARRDESARQQDEKMAKRRAAILRLLTSDAVHCAILSDIHLVTHEKRREALKHGAVLMSQIYAITVIHNVASNLSVVPMLKDQIRTYETIVAKLGPRHEAPVVTDALPKLKAALAKLEARG